MADPRADPTTPQSLERKVPGDERGLLPRPPEPLRGAWNDLPPVSRPRLRPSRKWNVLPFLIAVLMTSAAAGVGHHWYQRLNDEPVWQRVPATPTASTPDAPFSLRAAWRDISRRPATAQEPPASRVTPVISVLDDPGEAPSSAPQDPAAERNEPNPAAALAERMATAAQPATGNSAADPVTEKQAQPSPAPATPNPTSRTAKPASSASATHAPASAPVTVPATNPDAPQPVRVAPQRAPGMVGLGGPPSADQRETSGATTGNQSLPGPIPGQASRKPGALETALTPAVPHRASSTAHPKQVSNATRRSKPRKPLQRTTAPLPANQPSAEQPPVSGM
jgi:hypothetical protein